MLDYYHFMAYYYGMSYESLAYYYGFTDAMFMKEALSQATYNMAICILAEENNLAWTEDDFTAKYEEYVADYLETYPDDTRESACEYVNTLTKQINQELTEDIVTRWWLDKMFATE